MDSREVRRANSRRLVINLTQYIHVSDMGNWNCWNQTMSQYCDVAFVLYLDCPDDIMVARILQRGQSGARSDDNAETIKARFRVEETETKPIVELFRSAGKIRTVDANRDVDEVFADVAVHFDAIN